MYKGMDLTNLAQELERQLGSKKDLKAPTTCLEVVTRRDTDDALDAKAELILKVEGHGDLTMTPHFHDQVGMWAGIPSKYYDRMHKDSPALLAENLNHWLHHTVDPKSHGPQTRLVRVLDTRARAFLSNRYRTIDNYDIAATALPTLGEAGCRVLSSSVDENRIFIKAASDRLTREVKKGDAVQFGVVISNSEVGLGSVKIEPFIYRLICTNGMIIPESGLRKFHVGRLADELEAAIEVFRDETREADDKVLMMKIRDVLTAGLEESRLDEMFSRMKESMGEKIERPIVKVVEEVTVRHRLTDGQGESIMQHLAAGGDLTRWGLVNAVTRSAEDQGNYDEATKLERLGGEILVMDGKGWDSLAAA